MSLKKLIDILTFSAVGAALILGPALARAESAEVRVLFADEEAAEKPLRLHILAASDRPFDQSVKLAVRDQVTAYLEVVTAGCGSRQEAIEAIEAQLPLIEQVCNTCLTRCQAGYSARVQLETADFPSISYNGAVFAAGDYDALKVILGPGEGHNWWCVLFPPLCFVDLAASADQETVIAAWADQNDNDQEDREAQAAKESGYQISWKLAELLSRR